MPTAATSPPATRCELLEHAFQRRLPGDAHRPDRLRQDPARRAHRRAARPPGRDDQLPRRPHQLRPRRPLPRRRAATSSWQDGPLTRAVRDRARSATSTRSSRPGTTRSPSSTRSPTTAGRCSSTAPARRSSRPTTFMLVCSYNPAYRSTLKDLKPSFRQRFVTVALDYLPAEREVEVLVAETGIDERRRRRASCAAPRRSAAPTPSFHLEPPSTRTLVTAAHLVAAGVSETRGRRGLHPRPAQHRRRGHRRPAGGGRRSRCCRHAANARPVVKKGTAR